MGTYSTLAQSPSPSVLLVGVLTSDSQGSRGGQPLAATRRKGGLHFATYKAMVRRLGRFKSPTVGLVDLNEELFEPFFASIAVDWQNLFGGGALRRIMVKVRFIHAAWSENPNV